MDGSKRRGDTPEDADHFSQPGALFRLMTAAQKQALFKNTARSLGGAPREIEARHVAPCAKADKAYAEGRRDGAGRHQL